MRGNRLECATGEGLEQGGVAPDRGKGGGIETSLTASAVLSTFPKPTCTLVVACGLVVVPVWAVRSLDVASPVTSVERLALRLLGMEPVSITTSIRSLSVACRWLSAFRGVVRWYSRPSIRV